MRQAIVEHPFGTMKRQWGFDHVITKKGIQAASVDFGPTAIAYNLKRMLNIWGRLNELKRGPLSLYFYLKTIIKWTEIFLQNKCSFLSTPWYYNDLHLISNSKP